MKPLDLSILPHEPGCYLFKDNKGNVIYIGKAKDIYNRVSSYFSTHHDNPKTKALVSQIVDVSYIVTKNEVEAFLLENNLIKEHQPKYNINLKDSKQYAYLHITKEKFPRLRIARKTSSQGKFFGPFVNAQQRDYIKETLISSFKLRTCRRLPKRECLRYHIGLCSAPCIGAISQENYARDVAAVSQVLHDNTASLKQQLKEKMNKAASHQQYELALRCKRQLESLDAIKQHQQVQRQRTHDEDVINTFLLDEYVYIGLFHVKKGVLLGAQEFIFQNDGEVFEQFINQYYNEKNIPKELIVPYQLSSHLIASLVKRKGKKVIVTIPQRGEKKKLLELVHLNLEKKYGGETKTLLELKKIIGLQSTPKVIECFDISHLSGTATVASMVQFVNGKPNKSAYRRYKIKTVTGNDDFASMVEVVTRRYQRLKKEKKPFPDLIVIDGGKGQLTSALGALEHLGVRIPIISLAKRDEEVYTPQRDSSLKLSKKNPVLQLLQRLRDEAHRFAIQYNRKLRRKTFFSSSD